MAGPFDTPSLVRPIPLSGVNYTAFEAPKLPIYSASQIETFRDCPRKWAFDKIDRLPRAQTKAAELGERVHKQLERHLLGQGLDHFSDAEAAELASIATQHLPAPKADGLEVETSFTLSPEHGAHHWTGRIDWRVIMDDITIGDHKTTSSLQYAKSADTLATDVQANLYAWAALEEYPEPYVNAQWTYIQTRGAKSTHVSRVKLSRPSVYEQFEQIDNTAKEITALRRTLTKAIDYPYNSSSCDKYGGCPYLSKCNLSPAERMKSLMSTPFAPPAPGMSMLDMLKANQGALPAAPAPAAAPAAPSAPAAPAPHEDMLNLWPKDSRGVPAVDSQSRPLPQALIDRMAITGHIPVPGNPGAFVPYKPLTQVVAGYLSHYATHGFAEANPPAPAAAPAPSAPAAPAWAPPGALPPPPAAPAAPFAPPAAYAPPMGVNPPEAALPPAAPTGFAPPAPSAPANPFFPPPAPAAPSAPEAPTGKRKRRTKAEMEAARAAEAAGAPVGGITHTAMIAEATARAATTDDSDDKPIALLCIGCYPTEQGVYNVVSLADLVAEVRPQIKADMGVDDYAAIDYGKGNAALALYVARAVKGRSESLADLCVTLDTAARETHAVASTLAAMASVIVRGA